MTIPSSKNNCATHMGPSGGEWDPWFDGPSVSDDFMDDRAQPVAPLRYSNDLPQLIDPI